MKIYTIAKKKKRKMYETAPKNTSSPETPSQYEIIKEVRKEMPPPTKVHSTPKGKKGYDRKDKSWKEN